MLIKIIWVGRKCLLNIIFFLEVPVPQIWRIFWSQRISKLICNIGKIHVSVVHLSKSGYFEIVCTYVFVNEFFDSKVVVVFIVFVFFAVNRNAFFELLYFSYISNVKVDDVPIFDDIPQVFRLWIWIEFLTINLFFIFYMGEFARQW